MTDSKHLFWDSCLFIGYLARTGSNLHDIDSLISDALKKQRTIYYSTIALAEIRQRHLKPSKWGTVQDFFNDLKGTFEGIDPNPNILAAAGELRDAQAFDPSTLKPSSRVIGTADAIHLMTCVYLRDVLGVSDVVFQTLDQGKGTSWEGKCVPLLGFEHWFPQGQRTPLVEQVCNLSRAKPLHPQGSLLPVMLAAQPA